MNLESNNTEAVDHVTGDRVDNYARIVMIASTVSKLRKLVLREGTSFEFMNPDHARAMDKLALPSRLKTNKYVIIPEIGRSFYTRMGLFQHNNTKLWMGDRKKCSLLVPPISKEDETTNKGAAKVILSLLALFGIMEGQTYEQGEHGSVRELEHAANFEKRYLVIVGDGLSQMRARTFNEFIEDSAYSFRARGGEGYATNHPRSWRSSRWLFPLLIGNLQSLLCSINSTYPSTNRLETNQRY